MSGFPVDPAIMAVTDFLGVTVPYDQSGGLVEDLLEILEPIRIAGADLSEGRYPVRGDGSAMLKKWGRCCIAR